MPSESSGKALSTGFVTTISDTYMNLSLNWFLGCAIFLHNVYMYLPYGKFSAMPTMKKIEEEIYKSILQELLLAALVGKILSKKIRSGFGGKYQP